MAKTTTVQKQLRQFVETSKGRSYTVTIITLLLLMVLIFFAIIPAFSSIALQIGQNEERTEALELIDEKREALRVLLNKHNENLAVAVGVQEALPNDLDQEEIMRDLIQFSSDADVKLRSVRFVDLLGRSRLSQVQSEFDVTLIDGAILNLGIEGERAELRQFVSQLENSRRIYSVKSVNVTRVSERDVSFTEPFVMNLQAEVYFWNVNRLAEI